MVVTQLDVVLTWAGMWGNQKGWDQESHGPIYQYSHYTYRHQYCHHLQHSVVLGGERDNLHHTYNYIPLGVGVLVTRKSNCLIIDSLLAGGDIIGVTSTSPYITTLKYHEILTLLILCFVVSSCYADLYQLLVPS